jgi:signal transduction histidine kinase
MLKRKKLDQSSLKYRLTIGQKILAFTAILSFIGLSSSIVIKNHSSMAESRSLTAADAASSALIFVQRDTLVYTLRLTQWLSQQIPRQEVQIARATLAKRLLAINFDGKSIGQNPHAGYFRMLKAIDNSVMQSNPGILSSTIRSHLSKILDLQIKILIAQSQFFAIWYQKAVNTELVNIAKKSRGKDLESSLFLILFIVLSSSGFVWIARTSISQYRYNKSLLVGESRRLKILGEELVVTNSIVFELESLNESKNEFISNISHELRTPLTSIIGYVDVLAATLDFKANPQAAEIFGVLDRNVTILSSLVQSLLALSRLDSPHEGDMKKQIDLLSITEDAIFILQSEISKRNLQVTFNYDSRDAYMVQGDSGLLSQAAINLMANAVKFSAPLQEIQVNLERISSFGHHDFISLSIRDFGIGIPENEISRLSERFYRASNARLEHIPGTGLGLAIVAKVVEIHNANLLIASKLGEGTTFTIEFPAPVSPLDELIAGRKNSLLSEAITALAVNDELELKDKLHEYGGALGFYDFPELGEDLLAFSRSLMGSPGSAKKVTLEERDALVEKMKNALPAIEKEESIVE